MKIFLENQNEQPKNKPLCIGDEIDKIVSKLVKAEYILGDDEKQYKELYGAKLKIHNLLEKLANKTV